MVGTPDQRPNQLVGIRGLFVAVAINTAPTQRRKAPTKYRGLQRPLAGPLIRYVGPW